MTQVLLRWHNQNFTTYLGYERILEHAVQNDCFFEINSSPDRLDLSGGNARRASAAGVLIAINTDAHSIRELARSVADSIKLEGPG